MGLPQGLGDCPSLPLGRALVAAGIQLVGAINRLNAAVACRLAVEAGLPVEALRPAELRPLAHRPGAVPIPVFDHIL